MRNGRGSKMKKNGKLTKAEERKVADAMEITRQWLEAHMQDEPKPYGFWDLYKAHREFCDGSWIMRDE